MQKQQLFLDCDGVLADFDTGFERLTGTDSKSFEDAYGTSVFWSRIQRSDSFFARLPVMDQGRQLYNLVKHLRPIILTGTPVGDWSVPQKLRWRDKHFPGVPMVTCRSRDKKVYCQPGDVLIDDLLKYKHLWEEAGGQFIHYTNDAQDAYTQLKELIC